MGQIILIILLLIKLVIPNKFENFYNENIIRLPNSYMPTDNTRQYSNKPMTRKTMAYPKGIVFCCFNNNYKISSYEFDIWMRYFQKLKVASFGLKLIIIQQENFSCSQKRGIDPSRIIFAR